MASGHSQKSSAAEQEDDDDNLISAIIQQQSDAATDQCATGVDFRSPAETKELLLLQQARLEHRPRNTLDFLPNNKNKRPTDNGLQEHNLAISADETTINSSTPNNHHHEMTEYSNNQPGPPMHDMQAGSAPPGAYSGAPGANYHLLEPANSAAKAPATVRERQSLPSPKFGVGMMAHSVRSNQDGDLDIDTFYSISNNNDDGDIEANNTPPGQSESRSTMDESDKSDNNSSNFLDMANPAHLIEATLVTQDSKEHDDEDATNSAINQDIPRAEVVQGNSHEQTNDDKSCLSSKGAKWLCCWISALLAVVAVMGIVCGTGSCSSADTNESTPSSSPTSYGSISTTSTTTTSPSTAVMTPTISDTYDIRQDFPDYTLEAIDRDAQSPQARAFHWLSNSFNSSVLQAMPTWRIHQLMALGTIYYSFDEWPSDHINETHWLDASRSECDWTPFPIQLPTNVVEEHDVYTIECTDQHVTALRLSFLSQNYRPQQPEEDFALQGKLPQEIELLSKLQTLTVSCPRSDGCNCNCLSITGGGLADEIESLRESLP
ncbi:expressed unknown protein [Seminavis robusta]|uniref:Uncharacterized protein n=1 Tax=Seminavis robusta TaxID=568900 RepID=A0A9N8DG52_9STRA|nr:expressed unknown protein [Seminavis robusta]|eukprot:Sro75_g041130.1 n/a (548) ;mRNA; r:45769-47820